MTMRRKKFSTEERSNNISGSPMIISSIIEIGTSKKRSAKQHIWIVMAKKIMSKWSFLLSEGMKGKIALLNPPCFIFLS